jgi:hypothetical protein
MMNTTTISTSINEKTSRLIIWNFN